MLRSTDIPVCVLTDAIASFVHYLLAPVHKYEVRVEDDMVWVPPGPFIYGAESEGNLTIANIEHGFWIDRYPVTNAQFCEFLLENGNQEEGGVLWLDYEWSRIKKPRMGFRFRVLEEYEEHPVTGVSWYGSEAFAEWAKKRLPTEQEWEKAARGIDGRAFPWGEQFSTERCNTSESKIGTTTEVNRFEKKGASPYGAYDIAGNVWEWTGSWSDEKQQYRVLRGGSWYNVAEGVRCAYRLIEPARDIYYMTGFRCARTGYN